MTRDAERAGTDPRNRRPTASFLHERFSQPRCREGVDLGRALPGRVILQVRGRYADQSPGRLHHGLDGDARHRRHAVFRRPGQRVAQHLAHRQADRIRLPRRRRPPLPSATSTAQAKWRAVSGKLRLQHLGLVFPALAGERREIDRQPLKTAHVRSHSSRAARAMRAGSTRPQCRGTTGCSTLISFTMRTVINPASRAGPGETP